MQVIDPSFQIVEYVPNLENIFKHVTWCGYTCYKTEKETTLESSMKFIEKIMSNGHGAVLEHGNVVLYIPKISARSKKVKKKLAKIIENPAYTKHHLGRKGHLIQTNLRVIYEADAIDLLIKFSKPLNLHNRVTVKFITDLGVANELVRHRRFSFCQESTRYCNYAKDKFNKSLTFIRPSWFTGDNTGIQNRMLQCFRDCENTYLDLVDNCGSLPQQARQVLPKGLKTELIMTGFVEDWIELFKLRVFDSSGPAHPDMKKQLTPVYDAFVERKLIEPIVLEKKEPTVDITAKPLNWFNPLKVY